MADKKGIKNIEVTGKAPIAGATSRDVTSHGGTTSRDVTSHASSSSSILRLSELPSPRAKWKALGSREAMQLLNPSMNQGVGSGGLRANGSVKPDLKRTDSLTVPGSKERLLSGSDEERGGSRPSSGRSGRSLMSSLNLSGVQNTGSSNKKEEKEEKPKNTVQNTDTDIKSAIPYLPQWLAVICLILNIFIPGVGTMLSGFSILCCGKARIYSKEGYQMKTFCMNVMVGFMQLFTVPFMLVGWFWSFVWGIYMVILAVEYKQSEKAKREKQIQAKALTALNANLRPWTLMRN